MSGTSYSNDCPRCRGKQTLECYSDYKPFDVIEGICKRCGFNTYTNIGVLSKEELDNARDEDNDQESYGPFTQEQLDNIEAFDESYNIKKEGII
ncbi:MAG: hypothetical protein WC444_06050 [Candidatus Paceibacterota bacterium]